MRTPLKLLRGKKPWWLLLAGPGGLTAVLAFVIVVGLIGTLSTSSGASNSRAHANSAGTCSSVATSDTTGSTSTPGSAEVASSSAAAAASSKASASAALDAATGTLAPSALTAAEHVAGYDLSAEQVSNVQIIVGVGKAMNIDQRGMQVAVIVAHTESALNANASIDSGVVAGMFHQLAAANPGVNLADPVAATTAFYTALSDLPEYISPDLDPGRVAWAMQKHVSNYDHGATIETFTARDAWAKSLVQLLDTGSTTQTGTTPAPGTVTVNCVTGLAAVTVPGLTPVQAHSAQVIMAVGKARKLSTVAITIAISVAMAESNLMNYANDGTSTQPGHFADGHRQLNAQERAVARQSLAFAHDAVGHDLDSMGEFQQRPSASWGTPAQLMDIATAAGKFYDVLITISGYDTSSTPYMVAQTVQGSNDPTGGIYATTYPQAAAIVAALSAATPAAGGGVVLVNGPKITLPAKAGIAGTITAPNATVAKAITAGLNWLGEPYSYAAGNAAGPTLGMCSNDPNDLGQNDCHVTGFDCSGLMLYMWAQVGIMLPHYSQDQFSGGRQIPWDQKEPGDMIGYSGHIAMYVGTFGGVDYMLEAPESGEFVHVTPVRNKPSEPHYTTVSRVWK